MAGPCSIPGCGCNSFNPHIWVPKKCINCGHTDTHRLFHPPAPIPVPRPHLRSSSNMSTSSSTSSSSSSSINKERPPVPPRKNSVELLAKIDEVRRLSESKKATNPPPKPQRLPPSSSTSSTSLVGRAGLHAGDNTAVLAVGGDEQPHTTHHHRGYSMEENSVFEDESKDVASFDEPYYYHTNNTNHNHEEEEEEEEEEESIGLGLLGLPNDSSTHFQSDSMGESEEKSSLLFESVSPRSRKQTIDALQQEAEAIRENTRRMSFQEEDMSFSSKLIHKYHFVNEQVHAGLFSVKRIRGFFKKLCGIQKRFATELQAAVEVERQKLAQAEQRGYEPDRMATSWRAWSALLDSMGTVAQSHDSFALKVSENLFKPLDVFYAMDRDRVLEVHDNLQKNGSVMDRNTKSIQQEKTKCESLMKQYRQKVSDVERDGKASHISAATQSRMKALKAANAYDMLQKQSAHRREAFYTRELPDALDEMQVLEELRLRTMKKYMERFTSHQKDLVNEYKEMNTKVDDLLRSLNPKEDIAYFIRHCNSLHGLPSKWEPYEYDLSLSLPELQVENFENQHTVAFSGTLSRMIEIQDRLEPMNDYNGIPRVLVTLSRAVEQLGGLHAEGIFRISPSQREVQQLRERFGDGDYEITTTSPHVPAALLKFWLRDLKEPLIPCSLYNMCIEIGQQTALSSSPVTNNMSPFPSIPRSNVKQQDGISTNQTRNHPTLSLSHPHPHTQTQSHAHSDRRATSSDFRDHSKSEIALYMQIKGLLDLIPAVNRAVIHHVISFLRRVVSLSHINRMSASNLAIVFAPAFLRDEVTDPMQMLHNTKFAAQFVCHLIEGESIDILGSQPQRPSNSLSVSGIRIVSLKDAQKMHRGSVSRDESSIYQSREREREREEREREEREREEREKEKEREERDTQLKYRHTHRASTTAVDVPSPSLSLSHQQETRRRSQTYAPTDLPPNWFQHFDEHGTPYYVNALTKVSQWEFPRY